MTDTSLDRQRFFRALGYAIATTVDALGLEPETTTLHQPLAIRLLREDALGDIQDAYAVGWARYKKALAAVEALEPERFGGQGQTPLTLMDEQVTALVQDAWEAGVYIGDAFAKAELALEVERSICRRCGGRGVERREPDHPCAVCGGEGTVPAGD